MSEQTKELLLSWARIAVAAALAAFIAMGANPFAVDGEGLKAIVAAAVSATALTVFNWLRPGETRFGNGAETGTAVDG